MATKRRTSRRHARGPVLVAAVAVLVLAVGAACGDEDADLEAGGQDTSTSVPDDAEEGPMGIEGSTWVLDPTASTAPGGPLPEGATLALEGGSLGGSDGCNHLSGSYELDGDRLQVDELGSTMMACLDPPDVMERAERYTAALRSGATVEAVTADRLVLAAGDGARLEFTPEPPTPGPEDLNADALFGTWSVTLERSEGDGPGASVSATPAGTITFAADGTWTAQGPCNEVGGRWTSSGPGRLTLPEIGTNDMSCGAGLDEHEAELVDALTTTTGFSALSGAGAFQITGPDPALRLLLHPEEAPVSEADAAGPPAGPGPDQPAGATGPLGEAEG